MGGGNTLKMVADKFKKSQSRTPNTLQIDIDDRDGGSDSKRTLK